MVRMGTLRRRNPLGYSLPELFVALGLSTFLVAAVVWGFFSFRRTATIEDQKNELLALQRSIVFLMSQDLSASLRVTGWGRNEHPGLRRFPNSPRADEENDGMTLLVREFTAFPIPVTYRPAANDRVVFTNRDDGIVNKLFGLYSRASEIYSLFAVLNPVNQNVILKTGVHSQGNDTEIIFQPPPADTTVDFSGRQNLLLPLKSITWSVENNGLYRKVKYDPAGPDIESRLIARGVTQFNLEYNLEDLDRVEGRTVDLPSSQTHYSHIANHTCCKDAHTCAEPEDSVTCPGWEHIGRAFLTLKLRGEHEVDVQSAEGNVSGEGVSIENRHLVYTTSNVPLFPYGYLGFGSTQQMLQGTDMRCSLNNLSAAQCNPICAGEDGPFHGTNPSSIDWEAYGRPMFNRDGTPADNPSDICICGTDPISKTYIDPTSEAGHAADRMPNWVLGNAALSSRYEACATVYNGCTSDWIKAKYPVAAFACECTQSLDDYYSRSMFPREIHSAEIIGVATNTSANYAHRMCASWARCDDYAHKLGAASDSRYFRNQCHCLTHNISSTGVLQMENVVGPGHLSMFDLCSLASEPEDTWPPDPVPENGVCTDSWDVRDPGTGSVGHYILADPEHSPPFRPQGLSADQAMLCACLRHREANNLPLWKTRTGFANPQGVFRPLNSVTWTSWDFREKDSQPPGVSGLAPNSNQTTASNRSIAIDPIQVFVPQDSTHFLTRTLSNAVRNVNGIDQPVINCSLAQARLANPLWRDNLSTCTFRLEDNIESSRAIPEALRPWSGYCRNNSSFAHFRPEDTAPGYSAYLESCGYGLDDTMTSQQRAIEDQNIDALRHALSNTPADQPLPDWCGGPVDNSGGNFNP